MIASWLEEKLVFGSRADSLKVRNLLERLAATTHFATPGATFPDALLSKGAAWIVVDDGERVASWTCGSFPFRAAAG